MERKKTNWELYTTNMENNNLYLHNETNIDNKIKRITDKIMVTIKNTIASYPLTKKGRWYHDGTMNVCK